MVAGILSRCPPRRAGGGEKEKKMSAEEKIAAYLDRAQRYMNAPWEQRDPEEYKALLAMKAEICRECQEELAGQGGRKE